MPEYHSNDGGQRRRHRGGRNRNYRPGRNQESSGSSKTTQAKPTGFQRFLSAITFGLLGKSAPAPKARPQNSPSSKRPESGNQPRQERKNSEPRPPRSSPPPAEVTTERLYVGNLSYDATESDLFELFNGVGKVQNAEVVVNNRTQRSKGFAFVTMASVEEAKRAVDELHGKDFMGRPLQLSGAKPLPSRSEREESSSTESEAQPEQSAA